jgi:predicted branched-subunit amino acid permease
VAGAIFPVLFIGLASLACRTRSHAVRAVGAAALTAALAFVLPDLRALAPVVAGVVVALPGGDA